MLTDYVTGHIRTGVPILVGFLVGLAAKYGIDLNSPELVAAISGVAGAFWYGGVRALAERFPWAGILLGVNKAPKYPGAIDVAFSDSA